MADIDHEHRLKLTTGIVSSYVGKHSLASGDVPSLISQVYEALCDLTREAPAPEPLVPAVPVSKSVTPDYIISLEDGRRFKSLKRHLAAQYDMTPDDYRARWGLPADYPMVAPNYAAKRSQLAKTMGLGRESGRDGGDATAGAGEA